MRAGDSMGGGPKCMVEGRCWWSDDRSVSRSIIEVVAHTESCVV